MSREKMNVGTGQKRESNGGQSGNNGDGKGGVEGEADKLKQGPWAPLRADETSESERFTQQLSYQGSGTGSGSGSGSGAAVGHHWTQDARTPTHTLTHTGARPPEPNPVPLSHTARRR